jgi:hypothetical protein
MTDRDSSGRKETDLIDEISAGVHQLDAMLAVTLGEGVNFTSMSADLQVNYLWACHDRLKAVRDAWLELMDQRTLAQRRGGAA